MNDRERIGKTLAKLRLAADLSQRELSRRSGVSQVNICNIENGLQSVGLDTLSKISKALGKKVDIVD